ncbi:FAD/NAD(P)-binding domain-containing protein [Rhodofomes roseus]|uniref:FAD/NAD(P)-binding domain-containing protein n=1 Tax=Rhodofomes roseus TaxID=34475 RepID=A0ABQ8K017_9APHY|nr:FAD/NAD(P)-binding domain-containing protein [Rhodofomes roseus]KAH9829712.1 FAD/NAD(P)-binding domain-containing protein [Rhodofomes roseus]
MSLGTFVLMRDHCTDRHPSEASKSIAIVGGGSGGLAALKTILDVANDINENWEVVLFEQHRGLGGVWLPDPPGYEPEPPELPESPTYPLLHVNTPHPTMTYPHIPFPPGTNLYPGWDAMRRYHEDFATQFDLWPHVKLNHTVVSTQWHGHGDFGDWHVEVHSPPVDGSPEDVVLKRTFDHLVIANGHNHYPHVPEWNGTDDWLAYPRPGLPERQLLHSIYYRDPESYRNQTVVIVGTGASGRDIALQVGPLATVYQVVREGKETTPGADVIEKPEIAYFTPDAVVFVDGSIVECVDTVFLATGYDFRVPFLSAPHATTLVTDPDAQETSSTAQQLTSNLRYIYPLYQHMFSLAPSVPPTALAFVGLPVLIANCPSDYAQGMFIAHAIANSSLLPPRDEMLQDLLEREEALRAKGFDPYFVGHRLQNDNEAQTYQDNLVEYLKKQGAVPDDGKPYVEGWRRKGREHNFLILRGWKRIQAQGEEARWLRGVRTENQWAALLDKIAEWQSRWEEDHGISEEVVPLRDYEW